ncbi:MAG: hypothetical protein J3K34DRAFT_374708 [Monoraphidium minutum]|nr:MAG: hypothetical protein J3K34DRAFT_374708 [Monoraphidium minutum]
MNASLAERALCGALPALQGLSAVASRCVSTATTPRNDPGSPKAAVLASAGAPTSPAGGSTAPRGPSVGDLLKTLFVNDEEHDRRESYKACSTSCGESAWAAACDGQAGASCAAPSPPGAAAADGAMQLQGGVGACAPLLSGNSPAVGMESAVVFEGCWRRFQQRHGAAMWVPREIIFLNGAPGSGKGVNTPHILQTRGFDSSICVSSLLTSYPEARKFIDAGEMISDAVVCDGLLEELLGGAGRQRGAAAAGGAGGEYAGVVVDGFPRTAVQVDFLKLLHDKLAALHRSHADGPLSAAFPRPSFKVVVLYVDEETSVRRQLQRAAQTQARNLRALDAGAGGLQAARATDVSLDKARKRYTVFRHHYSAILRLKQFFPFHLIDAMGSPAETQEQIEKELRYQSGLDLSEGTYHLICDMPLARDLQQQARQQLVGRLEGYAARQRPLFGRVLDRLRAEVLPRLRQGGLAGRAEWAARDALFTEHPVAVDMLLDVLSDRGFQASYVREEVDVPVRFDAATGAITTEARPLHRFSVQFEAAGVRDGQALKALEISARVVEAARSAMAGGASASRLGAAGAQPAPITASFIPQHLDHSLKAAPPAAPPQRITRCTHDSPECEHAEACDVQELRAVAGGR